MEGLDAPKPIEHGSSKGGRWLRERRFRIAIWIAVAEGLLIVLHVVHLLPALILAAILIAIYAFLGRRTNHDTIRQATWVAAASQTLMILVAILVPLFLGAAIVLLAIIAAIALLVLFTDRA